MTLPERVYVDRGPMISGQGEAQDRKYVRHDGKSGRAWFVFDDNPSHVLVTAYADHSRKGEGFGGATLKVTLVDGSIFELHGGWHANPHDLFKDTGYDIRDRFMTVVTIGKTRSSDGPPTYRMFLEDILYHEEEPVMGTFDRGKEIAQRFADELGVPVQCASHSRGGGSTGPVYPTGRSQRDWDWETRAWKDEAAVVVTAEA